MQNSKQRVLAFQLGKELTQEEIKQVTGGQCVPTTEYITDTGTQCDVGTDGGCEIWPAS